jgi:predicted transcriptional regulator
VNHGPRGEGTEPNKQFLGGASDEKAALLHEATLILHYRRGMVVEKTMLRRWREVADPLGPLERVIMKQLWRSASGTSGEITTALNERRGRQLSPKTILTCLTRLEAKGLVTHDRDGRAYRFSPTMSEVDTAAWYVGKRLSEIVERYDDLAVAVFVNRFCGDPYRRQLVRRLLEALDEGSDA